MKIAICGSVVFANEMGKVRENLLQLGHEVELPTTADKILKGEFSLEDIKRMKESGTFSSFTAERDSIRNWFEIIKTSDAVLLLNLDKNNTLNYIGGNSFLELGFAHVLNKKKFLVNPIPEMSYSDEIISMNPVVLSGDLTKIL